MPATLARRSTLKRSASIGITSALLLLTVGMVPAASAATLDRFPSSYTEVTGTMTDAGNAYADDGVYATAVTSNDSIYRFGNFGLDAVPEGVTISSTTIEVKFHYSDGERGDSVSAHAYVDGDSYGPWITSEPGPTVDTVIRTADVGITDRDQLRDGTFEVDVESNRGGTTDPEPVITLFLDYVKVTVEWDTTGPDVVVPDDMTVPATEAAGAQVDYFAYANDVLEGGKDLTCTPPSGSMFEVGTTTVTCEAADNAGNVTRERFTITVLAFAGEGTDPPPPPATAPSPLPETSTEGSTGSAAWLAGLAGILTFILVLVIPRGRRLPVR